MVQDEVGILILLAVLVAVCLVVVWMVWSNGV